jgi:ElaA protein
LCLNLAWLYMAIHWTLKPFYDLTPLELYRILQLRSEVFQLEQQCLYKDTDNKDLVCLHVMGWINDELAAYCRIVPPGTSFKEASIGRVVSSPQYRKTGAGRELIKNAIEFLYNSYGYQPIRIGAQYYLVDFYNSFGFTRQGDIYLEDHIEHVEMLLSK